MAPGRVGIGWVCCFALVCDYASFVAPRQSRDPIDLRWDVIRR